ncbi:MAG: NF038122 family metalloprotease [Limisphaerales bacterium]
MHTRILAAAAALTSLAPGLLAQVTLPLSDGGSLPDAIHMSGCVCGAHGGTMVREWLYGGQATLAAGDALREPVTHSGFNIVISPGAGLNANPTALAAFNAAASQWEALFSDPVTVTINADLAPLGPGIIGSASSTILTAGYGAIRGQLVADNVGSVTAAVTGALPLAGLGVTAPAAVTSVLPAFTPANAKALGFGTGAGADSSITFSTAFGFDYDNSDGVGAGLTDFQTVALHEIGHALGFTSGVDFVDGLLASASSGAVPVMTLDFFRFGSTANPASLGDFSSFARNLTTGGTTHTDLINAARGSGPEYFMSTGRQTGDGRQASHWKDNDLSGSLIGVMDPTLGAGQVSPITAADLNAFDVIGWNVVPEPGEYAAAFGVAALGFAVWRRRGARRA